MEQYNITGMSCAACSARVEKAVSALDGVTSCSVNLLTNSMGVEGTPLRKILVIISFPSSFLTAQITKIFKLLIFLEIKYLCDISGRRQWHPTPVLLPGKSHGWRSLVGCSPWGR